MTHAAELPRRDPVYAYPHDLALLVQQRCSEANLQHDALPQFVILERLLSISYQASLLHEEGRPITFRAAFSEPRAFAAASGPPAGLHRLLFDPFRPFEPRELRRLALAVPFRRSLIGVFHEAHGEFVMWGLVHSGLRWLQAVTGGRHAEQSVPPVLIVAATGPGRLLVSHGTRPLAALAGGTLIDLATDVFAASWLATQFEDLREAQRAAYEAELAQQPEPRAPLQPAFGCHLVVHVLRRIVATIRRKRHGGMLVLLRAGGARELVASGHFLSLKYRFHEEEPSRRIFGLTVEIMSELARQQARSDPGAETPVGWAEYEATTDARLVGLDDALFEVAHLVAMLANVDGAVVMTDRLEILGFGAEISGALPDVDSVDRSLDLEGRQRISEDTHRVGTRHRSAYRLCQQLHDALVIVVSQDGGVRFVRRDGHRVTYFDQIASGPWEV